MDRYYLELTLELTEGSIHNIGNLLLLYRLWASTFMPTAQPAKAVTVLRDSDWKLTTYENSIAVKASDEIVQQLYQLGLPERSPDITPVPGNINGWQRLLLSISINGVAKQYTLDLQYNGATGKDAATLRKLIDQLLSVSDIADRSRFLII